MEWQSMMALGFLWTGRDYAQAGGWFHRARDLAERLADPTLRARSLNRLGNWLVNTERAQEGLEAHQEALQLFETRQNTQGMAETLDLLGVAYGFSGDPANAVKHFGRAVELFRTLGDSQSLVSSLAARALDSAPETTETTFSALRTRDVMTGAPVGQYDYFVANDEYGRNSYITLLTGIQILFGPTPYSMRLLNTLVLVVASLGVVLLAATVGLRVLRGVIASGHGELVGPVVAYMAVLAAMFACALATLNPLAGLGAGLFFCSDASSFVTGQVLTLDGGLTATQ